MCMGILGLPLLQVNGAAAGSCTEFMSLGIIRIAAKLLDTARRKMRFKHLDPNNSGSKLNFACGRLAKRERQKCAQRAASTD